MLLEYSVGADILIDHVTAHRNDPDMADDILLVDGHVGRAAPDVDHGDALLLFVLGKHRLGRSHGIQEQAQRSDSAALERHLDPADRRRVAQQNVERRGEFGAERAHRARGFLLVVDDIALRNDLQYLFPLGSRHVAHAVVQMLHVLLTDLAAPAEHMVRMLHATDMLARNAGVGLRDPDLLPLLDSRHGRLNTLRNKLDVLDLAANHAHPLHGGDLPVHDPNPAVLIFRTDDRDHRVGSQIDRNDVISVFHSVFHII